MVLDGWIEGNASAVAVSDTLLLLALSSGELRVFERRPADALYELARLPLPARPDEVLFDGEVAVVRMRLGGAVVVDVRDPRSPRIAAELLRGVRTAAVSRAGDWVCVVTEEKGILGFDVADPERPRLLWTIDDLPEGNRRRAVQAGNALFVTVDDTLFRYDLTRPGPPHASGPPLRTGGATCPDDVDALDVAGDTLYAWCDGLARYDLSDPEEIWFLGHVQARGAKAIRHRDGVVYGCSSGAGVIAWDVSDPTRLRRLGFHCPTRATDVSCPCEDIALHGDRLFGALGQAGLSTLAPLPPGPPGEVPDDGWDDAALLRTPTAGAPVQVFGGDDWIATLGYGAGLVVYDTGGRVHPEASRQRPIAVARHGGAYAGGVMVGEVLYAVAIWLPGEERVGVEAIDLTEPTAPVSLGVVARFAAAFPDRYWAVRRPVVQRGDGWMTFADGEQTYLLRIRDDGSVDVSVPSLGEATATVKAAHGRRLLLYVPLPAGGRYDCGTVHEAGVDVSPRCYISSEWIYNACLSSTYLFVDAIEKWILAFDITSWPVLSVVGEQVANGDPIRYHADGCRSSFVYASGTHRPEESEPRQVIRLFDLDAPLPLIPIAEVAAPEIEADGALTIAGDRLFVIELSRGVACFGRGTDRSN